MKGHRDLRLAVAVTVLCALASQLSFLGPVRIAFAAPLALFLPGYAVTAAIFGSRRLGWPELLPATIGISLACLALGSLLLNYTPGGIQGVPWTLFLVVLVVAGCAVAARRRGPTSERSAVVALPKPKPLTVLLAIGTLALVVAALVISQTTVRADHVFGYTQLWIKPQGAAGAPARIGVTSEQQGATHYRLKVLLSNRGKPQFRAFALQPGETRVVTVGVGHPSQPTRVEALLYTRGHPDTVYRRVFAVLPAAPGAQPTTSP